jgi:hypothetical protein
VRLAIYLFAPLCQASKKRTRRVRYFSDRTLFRGIIDGFADRGIGVVKELLRV